MAGTDVRAGESPRLDRWRPARYLDARQHSGDERHEDPRRHGGARRRNSPRSEILGALLNPKSIKLKADDSQPRGIFAYVRGEDRRLLNPNPIKIRADGTEVHGPIADVGAAIGNLLNPPPIKITAKSEVHGPVADAGGAVGRLLHPPPIRITAKSEVHGPVADVGASIGRLHIRRRSRSRRTDHRQCTGGAVRRRRSRCCPRSPQRLDAPATHATVETAARSPPGSTFRGSSRAVASSRAPLWASSVRLARRRSFRCRGRAVSALAVRRFTSTFRGRCSPRRSKWRVKWSRRHKTRRIVACN